MSCSAVSKISLRGLEQREQLMNSLYGEQMSETPPGLSCFSAIFINCSFEQSWCWWLGLIKHTWENPQKQSRSIRMEKVAFNLINKGFFLLMGLHASCNCFWLTFLCNYWDCLHWRFWQKICLIICFRLYAKYHTRI